MAHHANDGSEGHPCGRLTGDPLTTCWCFRQLHPVGVVTSEGHVNYVKHQVLSCTYHITQAMVLHNPVSLPWQKQRRIGIA